MQAAFKVNPAHFGIPLRDAGWIYAVRTGDIVKGGKTTDPQRRLLREANTWCPNGLDEIIAKPFWNIGRLEYSLHVALAQHWHRGEWHKFTEPYWQQFFLDAFRLFKDGDESRDANSVNFAYWMNDYSEILNMRREHKMTLPQWRQCRADPWMHTRESLYAKMRDQSVATGI